MRDQCHLTSACRRTSPLVTLAAWRLILNAWELFLRVNKNNQLAIGCYLKNGLVQADHDEYRIKFDV